MRATAINKAPLRKWGDVEIIDDVEQGSDDWFALRLGIPTASCFSMVVRDADSVTRDLYMRVLAGERLTGAPGEAKKFVTAAMERGKEMEPEALEHFARKNFGGVERVGFMRRKLPSGRYVGCSPDALFDKRRSAIEVKTLAPHLMIERLVKGSGMPPEHRWQVYGTMLVGQLDVMHLKLFYRGMPVSPLFKVGRDETVIKELSDAIERFDHELNLLVEKIQKMGVAQ